MAVAPVATAASTNLNSLGLDFQSLLQIILTQLQYQDPLKPMDNFEFISQLAQFTSLEQTQQLNNQITSLLTVQSASQATDLLGKTVDLTSQGQSFAGTVQAVSFSTGSPTLTIATTDGQTLTGIALSAISDISLATTPATSTTTP
jgi:flagellar basal-body rod modification protein FlgD